MKYLVKRPSNVSPFDYYGINRGKFLDMYQALRDKGITNYSALMHAYQSNREVPNGYYAFVHRMKNVNDWASRVDSMMRTNTYKGMYKTTNYDEYRKAAAPYNTSGETYWTDWLPDGIKEVRDYVNKNYRPVPIDSSLKGL